MGDRHSSGGLADREKHGGDFTWTTDQNGEFIFTRNSERAAHAAWKAQAMSGKPVGVTRLGAGEIPKGEPTVKRGGQPANQFSLK